MPDTAKTEPSKTEPAKYRRRPAVGERLASLRARTNTATQFNLDMLAGRYALVCLFGSMTAPNAKTALSALKSMAPMVDTRRRVLVGISIDPRDETHKELRAMDNELLLVWDQSTEVTAEWGFVRDRKAGAISLDPAWVLLDPGFRVMGLWPLAEHDAAIAAFEALGHPDEHVGIEQHAPVLVVPRVFEPEFCAALMQFYKDNGGEDSGVTKEKDGQTYVALDHKHKRRFDCIIEDDRLRNAIQHRIFHRLRPEIQKAYQFNATRMERYLIAQYDSGTGGYFKPHRDNTTKGTAHRRFAVSLNLNAEDYEGGNLRFPEFGQRTYSAPSGGAVVFSCSLMHEATPVLSGQRFVFLPFLYDDAAAEIREANQKFLDPAILAKRATSGSKAPTAA